MLNVLSLCLALAVQADAPAPNWIWSKKPAGEQDVVYFRKTFDSMRSSVVVLTAACDNQMKVYLNGSEVARGSEWSQPVNLDVRAKMVNGKNVLAVEARNAGGPGGLCVMLEVAAKDKKPQRIVTDGSWTWSAKPSGKWREAAYDDSSWNKAVVIGRMGVSPWGNVFGGKPSGSDGKGSVQAVVKALEGFTVEKIYTVPKATQGSWVGMTALPNGDLVASDQGGKGLYRITPGPEPKVRKIDVPVSGAQGMVWAFDALYANVNGRGAGLWKITDANGDGKLDKAEHLIPLAGGGEHGPHAVIVTEDGKGLYFIGGNHTKAPPDLTGSRISQDWREDLLLPRQWDARGHARGKLAPGGWVCRVSPDGKQRELISIGYRNQYDIALNRHGEMFTYDADMEWDLGMPWYRPTRVNHVVSGSEFGWRSGTGKWPEYYPDSLPAVVNIGPGSPTGVLFGTGAKFPAKYQDAFYILDWTYGTIWAVHLKPDGASYTADVEEFVSGQPLPVTDAAVGADGLFYFAVGGRGTQSALYRVSYEGGASTAPATGNDSGAAARAKRRSLEKYHGRKDGGAIEAAWPYLSDSDRYLRYAARIALESQPVAGWKSRALAEKDPQGLVTAMVGLARADGKASQGEILGALNGLDLKGLPEGVTLEALRAYGLAFTRGGEGTPEQREALLNKLEPLYPAKNRDVNQELAGLLCFLGSRVVIPKSLELMASAEPEPAPDWVTVLDRNRGYGGTVRRMLEKMPPLTKLNLAFVLRNVRFGWTLEQRRAYFEFLRKAETEFKGGASYGGFVKNIRKEALANCSENERRAVADLTGEKVTVAKPLPTPDPKGPGKAWSMNDAADLVGALRGRSFENGRRSYLAAKCAACHRFDGEGGDTGPDLSGVAGRFSPRDLLESILQPSKVVSDQYQASVIRTKTGKVVTGRILEEKDGKLHVATDLMKPAELTVIARADIDAMKPSTVSPMPEKLADPLNRDELLDMLAYLLSAGDSGHRVFR